MRKTMIGRTGLEISELAFGGGVTGGILINPDEVTRYGALRRAVEAGINWIDTAPAYGNGASEETIGRHLASLSPQPHVSTKVRLEAEDLDDIPGAIERSLEQSLKRLRSDWVALLQLHNHLGHSVGERLALTPEQVLDQDGVADTFDRLKEQGVIQAGGITAAGDTRACLKVIDSGRFDAAQVYYNAINPSAAWRRVPPSWRGGQDFCGILAARPAGERGAAKEPVRDDRRHQSRQRNGLCRRGAVRARRRPRHAGAGGLALRARQQGFGLEGAGNHKDRATRRGARSSRPRTAAVVRGRQAQCAVGERIHAGLT
jgi:aryl-alcohol dehydrogenase-like predicted oxidoreductase